MSSEMRKAAWRGLDGRSAVLISGRIISEPAKAPPVSSDGAPATEPPPGPEPDESDPSDFNPR